MYRALGLVLVMTILGGYSTYKVALHGLIQHPTTKVEQNQVVAENVMIPFIVSRKSKKSEEVIKVKNSSKTITLEKRNLLVLRGPVTEESASRLQQEANDMSLRLSKNEKIYLVLDTPGGSISAGMTLIDHLKALPQRVETITLFSASMGFQIVQNMDKRYITTSGTLMSHRARGGIRGEFGGELETRYRSIVRQITYLEAVASRRIGISLDKYRDLIKDEYWVDGFDAVAENVADEMVSVTCGKSLRGTTKENVDTMFGQVTVELSKCPLIKGFLSIDMSKLFKKTNAHKVKKLLKKGYQNQRAYVKDYVITGKHYEIFK